MSAVGSVEPAQALDPRKAVSVSSMQGSSLVASTSTTIGSDGSGGVGNMKISNKTKSESTYKSLAHAIIPELPALMHGSGDVRPEHVHPQSVATLARLVEKYVASLVSAALDAHDVFTDGQVVGGGACLGPPPFRHAMGGGIVGEDEGSDDDDDEDDDDDDDDAIDEITKKRKEKAKALACRKKAKIDYWDVPLPVPPPPSSLHSHSPADAESGNNDDNDDDDSDEDDELPMSMLSPLRRNSSSGAQGGNNNSMNLLLCGFAPVDLHANERSRNYYVAAPSVMDARSFIFPICHDAVLYQRIKEVQANRRSIHRDVVDNALLEVMREEGIKEGQRGVVDAWDAVLGSRASNNVDTGLTAIVSGDKKKKTKGDNVVFSAKDNEKTKVGGNNTKNLVVGAGLVDSDVDPSWPGLNSLLRGKLW